MKSRAQLQADILSADRQLEQFRAELSQRWINGLEIRGHLLQLNELERLQEERRLSRDALAR